MDIDMMTAVKYGTAEIQTLPCMPQPLQSGYFSLYFVKLALVVAPQLTVVTRTIARSGVAESEKDVHAASVVPSETTAHETTAVRASSSNGP